MSRDSAALRRVVHRREPGAPPFVYAHRGSPKRVVENTLASLALGLDEGADGVELDVRRCRTGEVVVHHDPELWRLLGEPLDVAELRFAELRARRIEGEPIPTLDEALDLVLGRGGRVNVEIKGDVPDRVGTARAVAHVLGRRSARERARLLVSTFSPVVHRVCAGAAPGVAHAFLFDRDHTGLTRAQVAIAWLGPDGLHPEGALVGPLSLRLWRARSRFVNAWTINRPERVARLAALGVDGIITDDVPGARRALGLAGR